MPINHIFLGIICPLKKHKKTNTNSDAIIIYTGNKDSEIHSVRFDYLGFLLYIEQRFLVYIIIFDDH